MQTPIIKGNGAVIKAKTIMSIVSTQCICLPLMCATGIFGIYILSQDWTTGKLLRITLCCTQSVEDYMFSWKMSGNHNVVGNPDRVLMKLYPQYVHLHIWEEPYCGMALTNFKVALLMI